MLSNTGSTRPTRCESPADDSGNVAKRRDRDYHHDETIHDLVRAPTTGCRPLCTRLVANDRSPGRTTMSSLSRSSRTLVVAFADLPQWLTHHTPIRTTVASVRGSPRRTHRLTCSR